MLGLWLDFTNITEWRMVRPRPNTPWRLLILNCHDIPVTQCCYPKLQMSKLRLEEIEVHSCVATFTHL